MPIKGEATVGAGRVDSIWSGQLAVVPHDDAKETSVRNLSSKNRVIGGAITILVLGVVGLVYAAWTTSGTGSGYAKAGESQDLTTIDISGDATVIDLLYPGASGDVKIRIDNPNSFPVTVSAINGNGAITSDVPACNAGASVSYTNQSGTFAVPANSAATFVLNNAASMSNAANDDCQNATFTIPVSLTGQSG